MRSTIPIMVVMAYSKGKGDYVVTRGGGGHRRLAGKTMLLGALRPHTDLQRIIDQHLLVKYTTYMTLHARIKPDMQQHPYVCVAKTVFI